MTGRAITQGGEASLGAVMTAPRFVGRERELAALAQALSQPPAVVLIEGEAGIGKTRLVEEHLATMSRTVPLVAVCPPFRAPLTLGPIVDAVRQAASDVADLPLTALAGALRPLFPEWATDLPAEPEPAEDATAARHRLFRALVELLAGLDVGVLVVEDVHWADEATMEFLLFVVSRRPPPCSVVVTYRPEDLPSDSLLSRLTSGAAGIRTQLRLTLGPLNLGETSDLMSSMLAGERISAEFAARVHGHTDGVPLVVEESVRLMGERADLARRDGAWVRRRLSQIDVPRTVRDAVLERFHRLGADSQMLLQAAAVLADPADETLLFAVGRLPVAQGRAGLGAALDAGLLREDRRGLVSFRHAVAGWAVYEAITPPMRRALHLRAGDALERASPSSIAPLARHFRMAGDVPRWRTYAEAAADRAAAAGDEAAAAVFLYELVTRADLPCSELARLTNKITLLVLTGERRLRGLARVLQDRLDAGVSIQSEEADLRFQLGRVLLVLDEGDAARAQFEMAVPNLAHNPLAAARASMLLGWPRGATHTAAWHRAWLRRAVEFTASLPSAERLRMVVDRITALLILGQPEAWEEADRIPDAATTSTERFQITRGHSNIGEAAMVWGRYAESRARLSRAFELANTHEYLRLRDSAVATLAHLDWLMGQWDGLAERLRAFTADDDLPPMSRLEALLVAGLLSAAVGERALAANRINHVIAEARRRGAVEYLPEPAAALARLELSQGRVEQAVRFTEEPAEIVARKRTWIWATDLMPVRTEALLAAGRSRDAADQVIAYGRGLHGRDAPAPKAALTLCRATLAAHKHDHTRAASLFAAAATSWQALPRPYHALLAQEQQAACLLAAGKSGTALSLLSEVERHLAALGASGDADRVAHCLREHAVLVPRTWRGGPRGYGRELSPRERDVVQLVGEGKTNREIATVLFRSPNTVANQLRSAMRKLGLSSRAALARHAAEAGFGNQGLPPHPDGPSLPVG